MFLIPHLNFRRFAAVALLVLLFGQLAALIHAVEEEHEPGEVCEVCAIADRLSDALIPAETSLGFAPIGAVDVPVTPSRIHEHFAHIVRSRGPPAL